MRDVELSWRNYEIISDDKLEAAVHKKPQNQRLLQQVQGSHDSPAYPQRTACLCHICRLRQEPS